MNGMDVGTETDTDTSTGPEPGTQPEASGAPDDVRRRLALALDVDDLVAAVRLARELRPWFGTMKVGLELYSAAGPEAVSTLLDLDVDVFCDLKLHDIPTTVERSARVLGALGVRYLNVHAAGGPSMVRAGVEGLRDGAAGAGLPDPVALAVTVLTSEPDASTHLLHQRVTAGLEGGCDGFVCGAPDLTAVRQLAPRAVLVTPGIRPQGAPADDQARVATPARAAADGADLLVLGRAVTRADDPVAAAQAITAELSST
jgi:orotidine-5'-phosphate decarboxylase